MQKRVVPDGRIRTKKFSFGEKKVLESSETCKNAKKRVVQESRIRTEKKVLESSETCKNAKKRVVQESRSRTKKKVLESSETCKNAKKEWSRKVEFGRKKIFFYGKKKF